ncbi:MAG: enoyl-CoA hydratase/isomerase family protein [Halioglobus sp.]|nr:enoyl-CoA hydratase/isomerase family protein [Halioglobus sp.]
MSYSITVDWVKPEVAILTFSDHERSNQICWAAIDDLAEHLRHSRECGARVVILASGVPGQWLQHAWLQDLLSGLAGLEQTGTGAGWFATLNELSHEDVISIAAISGDCSGGGAELGWACDFRIAEKTSRFSQPEINMGLTTGIGGSSRLAQLAGRATATEMVLTGKPMSAERLCALGAVNRVVQSGQALEAALELGAMLAEKSPHAVAGLKRILASSDDASLTDAMIYEQEVFQSVVSTPQAVQGMRKIQSGYDCG